MNSFKNILVALDLSEMDTTLIRYASFISEKLGANKVYFVHNIKKYEISELFEEQLKDINLDKMISEELDEKVSENFSSDCKWEVLISEDPYTESLINYVVHKYNINLVMVGNKNNDSGTGVITDKLLRLLKCDVLSIPQHPTLSLENVWAGTDFSKESRKVFHLAEFLEDKNSSQITAAHIYSVPIQFSPYLAKEEMVPKIEKHKNEKFDKFLSQFDIKNIQRRIIRGREVSVAERLASEAEKSNANILIVGDKGGNLFSSLLVGSVTDELFNNRVNLPLWVVK